MSKYLIPKIVFIVLLILRFSWISGEPPVTYFYEDFEEGISGEWKQVYISGSVDWKVSNGGHTTDTSIAGSNHPAYAWEGSKNALFHYTSLNREVTRLITPRFNLGYAVKPELHFMHSQEARQMLGEKDNNKLRVYFHSEKMADTSWFLLADFFNKAKGWHYRSTLIPDSLMGEQSRLAFEGINDNGWGVCLDSIEVIESGIIDRYVDTVAVHQVQREFVPSGSQNNPILRIDFIVTGNKGHLVLNELSVNTLNTNADNIASNGVKLFTTQDQNFNSNHQIGSGKDLQNTVTFTQLGDTLQTGINTVWLTYDVNASVKQPNILDAMVEYHSISVNDLLYPSKNQDPAGFSRILETIFADDFESDKGWIFTGEFQRNSPQGLGGSVANPDPEKAFSGNTIIGTDLTGLNDHKGDYEDSLASREYKAISPSFDGYYVKNVYLKLERYLNIEIDDSVFIDISTDQGNNWKNYWFNNGTRTESRWNRKVYDISNVVSRTSGIKIRFALGSSDGSRVFSGWNIDDVSVMGNYIRTDVQLQQLIAPVTSPDLSDAESIKIQLANNGANPITNPVPLKYIIETESGKRIISEDTLNDDLAVNDTVNFTFQEPVNFEDSGYYTITLVNSLANDEFGKNDTLTTEIYNIPTFQLPYVQDFEQENNFWLVADSLKVAQKHKSSSWEWGVPKAYLISDAFSGSHIWCTNLNGNYTSNDTSYLVSPYFDFTGVSQPYIEFMSWINIELDNAGVSLQYSIDRGNTWHTVNEHVSNPYNWEWYNKHVTVLGTKGWDTTTLDWMVRRQFLPPAVTNQIAKFRFKFASGSLELSDEGFGLDNIIISGAPPDLGVSEIYLPEDTCQLSRNQSISIEIKNYSGQLLSSGEQLIAGLMINDSLTHRDTLQLAQNLPENDTLLHTFRREFDMYKADTYDIKVFVKHKRDNDAYHTNNDTLSHTLKLLKPRVNLGDDIYSFKPDTVTLEAPYSPDYSYLWQDGTTQSTYQVDSAGTYSVTVTDQNTGCNVMETVTIVKLASNIGVDSILKPVSDCRLGNNESVQVRVVNSGIDTFHPGNTFELGYQINNRAPVTTTYPVTGTVYPGDTLLYSFDEKADLRAIQSYDVRAFVHYDKDNYPQNDSVYSEIIAYGPDFDLTPDDTIHAGFEYLLNADYKNEGDYNYLWEDGTTDSTLLVTDPERNYYTVTVTETHESDAFDNTVTCKAKDSSLVGLVIPDLEMHKLRRPRPANCAVISDGRVVVAINNKGSDTLSQGTSIPVSYKLANQPLVTEQLTLASPFYPKDTLVFEFNSTVNLTEYHPYKFKTYISWDKDSVRTNDTIQKEFYIYEDIQMDLGFDDTTIVDQPEFTLEAGNYKHYLWHDGTRKRTFTVDASNAQPSIEPSVTVTNVDGCKASDTASVTLLFNDIAVSGEMVPDTVCGFIDTESFDVEITNKGTKTLNSNIIDLSIAYTKDTVTESFEVSEVSPYMHYGDSVVYASEKIRETSPGFYKFSVEANMANDARPANDTFVKTVHLKGAPSIVWKAGLGSKDTIEHSLPYNIGLEGFYDSCSWNTNSSGKTIQADHEGLYRVTVFDGAGCYNTDFKYIKEPSAISRLHDDAETLQLYPNPASQYITLSLEGHQQIYYTIQVFNSSGKLKYTHHTDKKKDITHGFSVKSWQPGMYYVRISSSDGVVVRKFMVF